MRPSLRFLFVAILGWTVLRAAALGSLPGAALFRIERSEAKVPPIAPTQFPKIEPAVMYPAAAPEPASLAMEAATSWGWIHVTGSLFGIHASATHQMRHKPIWWTSGSIF